MAVDGNNQREADGGFGGGDADRKNNEHDAGERLGMRTVPPERDEVEVGGVEHEFDADEDEDGVAARQRAGEADGEEQGGEDEVRLQGSHGRKKLQHPT